MYSVCIRVTRKEDLRSLHLNQEYALFCSKQGILIYVDQPTGDSDSDSEQLFITESATSLTNVSTE